MAYINFRNDFKEYTESGNIDSGININAVTFINKGTSIVKINDTIILDINDSLAIGGNIGEIDVTNYKLSFEIGAFTNLVFVTTKVYV